MTQRLYRDILDLACGSGFLLELCKKRFSSKHRLFGVDMNVIIMNLNLLESDFPKTI